jgi:phosphatidylserine synthase
MTSIVSSIYLFCLSLVLAYLEVQIEGRDGWAAKLPTWRVTKGWIVRWTGGRPLTGYHVALTAFLLLFFHYPALWTEWTWSKELAVLSSYLLLVPVWDFLWFVLNPAYGLERYNTKHVWWFRRWFLGFPVDYYVALVLSLVMAWCRPEPSALGEWVMITGGLVVLTALAATLRAMTRKI